MYLWWRWCCGYFPISNLTLKICSGVLLFGLIHACPSVRILSCPGFGYPHSLTDGCNRTYNFGATMFEELCWDVGHSMWLASLESPSLLEVLVNRPFLCFCCVDSIVQYAGMWFQLVLVQLVMHFDHFSNTGLSLYPFAFWILLASSAWHCYCLTLSQSGHTCLLSSALSLLSFSSWWLVGDAGLLCYYLWIHFFGLVEISPYLAVV